MDLDGDKNFSDRYMYFSMPTLLADGLAEYFKTFFSMALGYTCSTAIKFVYYSKIFCPGCSFPNYCAVGNTIIFHNATQADFGRTQYTS